MICAAFLVLCAQPSLLNVVRFAQSALWSGLRSAYFELCALPSVLCALCFAHRDLCHVLCPAYLVLCDLRSVPCALCSAQCALCCVLYPACFVVRASLSVLYALCIAQRVLCSVLCPMCIVLPVRGEFSPSGWVVCRLRTRSTRCTSNVTRSRRARHGAPPFWVCLDQGWTLRGMCPVTHGRFRRS